MRELVILLKNGVPYSEVMRMSSTRRMALVVAIGELDGNEFDWNARRWKD